MKRFIQSTLVSALLYGGMIASVLAEGASVELPVGYRDWTHVKSMVILNGHGLYESFGGIHHIYANDKALRGYRNGKFPDGSIIVFDLLDAPEDDKAINEGPRKVLGVMEKDSHQFESTGGWGFEGFASGDPTKRVVGKNADTACFQCHTSQEHQDFVFSKWRN